MKHSSRSLRAGARHQLGRCASREDFPRVHRDDPVPLLRLVHVSGGDRHAHARPIAANVVDQRPELAPRKGIDPRSRLVEDEQVRVVDKSAAESHFLLHAPREFSGGPIAKRPQSSGLEQLLHAERALGGREPEELRHEVDVVVDAELEIEILAEALRHVRDPRTHVAPVPDLPHVAAEHVDAALLQLLRSGNQSHQRRLADAVWTDDADHDPARNVERDVVERDGTAVAVSDVANRGDRLVSRQRKRDLCHRDSYLGVAVGSGCAWCGGVCGDQALLHPVRPHGGIVRLHVADAAHTGLDVLDEMHHEFVGHLDLHAEHQLLALALRLDLLRGELGLRRHEADTRRGGGVRSIVEGDSRLRTNLERCRLFGRQEDLHVDVFQVHECQRLAAGSENLARFREAIQHAAVYSRDQRRILDSTLGLCHVGLGDGDLLLGGLRARL